MAAFLHMVKEQLFFTPPYPEKKHTGQTIIVTGANTGLGLEAARHFTRLDAEKVIVAVRSVDKGEAAKKSIEETTKRQGVVEVWPLDLSSYESVKQFAKKLGNLKRVDAVVENAGKATRKFELVEGDESTISKSLHIAVCPSLTVLAINVISTFLLALLVLPKLRETASRQNVKPYLSIVNSEVHGFTTFPEKDSPNIFEELSDKATARMDDR